jgi:protein-S-isoprenylcysteine O-methyltransferase Ste14
MPLIPARDGAAAAPDARRQGAVAVDLAERLVLLALYLWFLHHFIPSMWGQPYNMLVMIAETFTITLVLIRRTGETATNLYAWAIAFTGTCLPLFVAPSGPPIVPVWGAVFLMLYGLLISVSAKLSLRRSFGVVAARRSIRHGGPYRIIRHPMYLGYIITNIGALLINPSVWNLSIYGSSFLANLLRIAEEERMLSQDSAYRDYVGAVRFRLIPGLF